MSAKTSSLPVVLLHGLLSTPREFGMVAFPLRAAGVRLITPTIEGYTLADRHRPVAWQDWASEAAHAIRRELTPGEPFVLGGLCSGGMLAAALTLQGGLHVQRLALISPTFAYDGWGQTRWRHLRALGYALRLDRRVFVPERTPFGVKNPKIRQWVEREMQQRAASAAGPSSLPLWAIHEVERVQRYVFDRLPGVRVPTLVMHAREDEVCSLPAVQAAYERLPAAQRSMCVLEDSYHMVTIDNDRHRVAAELSRFAALAPLGVPATAANDAGRPESLHTGSHAGTHANSRIDSLAQPARALA